MSGWRGSSKGRGRGQSRGSGRGKGGGAGPQKTWDRYDRSSSKREAYGGSKGDSRGGIPAIEMRESWHLHVARPYPGEHGCTFIRRGGARHDRDIVDVDQLGDRLSLYNCEAMNRPGKWLSMLGATVHQGGKLGVIYSDKEKLNLTGVPDVLSFFASEGGQAIVCAATHLDDFAGEVRTATSVKDALDTLLEHFATDEMVTSSQRLNMFSLHMYNLTSQLLQGKALMRNRENWAAQLSSQAKLLPGKARDFVSHPDDDRALVDMLVACYRTQILTESKTQGGRRGSAADPLGAGDDGGDGDGFYDMDDEEECDAEAMEDEGDDGDPLATAAPASSRRFSSPLTSAARFGGKGSGGPAGADERRFTKSGDRKRPADVAVKEAASPARRRFGARDAVFASPVTSRDKEAAASGGPAPKPRFLKPAAKSAAEPGDASSAAPEAAVVKTKVPEWSLSELVKFKEAAAFEINEQNLAEAEAEKQKELLDRIPVALRKEYGLPTTTGDLAVLKKNAQKNAATIVEVVQAAQLAWIDAAEVFNDCKHWSLEEDLTHGAGLLRVLLDNDHGDADLQTRMQGVLDSREPEEGVDKDALADETTEVVHEVLTSLMSEATAAHCFQLGHEFCNANVSTEPTAAAVRALLDEMPSDARSAVGMQPREKYLKIKSKFWKADISRFLTVAYMVVDAYSTQTAL